MFFWSLTTFFGPWLLAVAYRLLFNKPRKEGGLFLPFWLIGFGMFWCLSTITLAFYMPTEILTISIFGSYSVACFLVAKARLDNHG